jgi:hypothetical protein
MQIYLAPLVLIVAVLLILFGNAKAQTFAPAMYWLGWAFTLYEFSSKIALSIH